MPEGKRSITLKNTTYIPNFLTNLVFEAQIRAIKIYFNNKKEYLYIKRKYINSLPFIQYNKIEDLIN